MSWSSWIRYPDFCREAPFSFSDAWGFHYSNRLLKMHATCLVQMRLNMQNSQNMPQGSEHVTGFCSAPMTARRKSGKDSEGRGSTEPRSHSTGRSLHSPRRRDVLNSHPRAVLPSGDGGRTESSADHSAMRLRAG